MENNKIKDKIDELVESLNRASKAYYNGADEIMPNYEWDALFDELTQLEEKIHSADSLSHLSAPVSKQLQIIHKHDCLHRRGFRCKLCVFDSIGEQQMSPEFSVLLKVKSAVIQNYILFNLRMCFQVF